jgi:tetratricopeptide (TPR) repeat protein
MRSFYLILIQFFLGSLALAQIQKGNVRLINSGKKPVNGVYISFSDAKAAESDVNGIFRLVFSGKKAGDLIFKEKIAKQGYELVNAKDLEVSKLSNSEQFNEDIILAVAGTLDAARKEYYNISDQALLASFEKQKKALRDELQKAKLNQEEFAKKFKELQDNYELQRKNLDDLAEKFAKINFDDAEPIYTEAFNLYKEGKIEDAIKKLERLDLIKRTEKRLDERERIRRADSILQAQKEANEEGLKKDIQALELQADMYNIQNNVTKAKAIYEQLYKLDSTNFEILNKAAFFYYKNRFYQLAIQLYTRLNSHSEAKEWQIANVYDVLGELYALEGNLSKSLEAYLKYNELYLKLNEFADNTFYKLNLAFSYRKLAYTYYLMGNGTQVISLYEKAQAIFRELNKKEPQIVELRLYLADSYNYLGDFYFEKGNLAQALSLFEDAYKINQQLYVEYPKIFGFRRGFALSNLKLGNVQLAMGKVDSALAYYQKNYQLFNELYQEVPKIIDYKDYFAIANAKMGDIYQRKEDFKNALSYYQTYNQLEKELAEAYPGNVNFKQTLAISYQYLSLVHRKLGNKDKLLGIAEKMNTLFQELVATSPQNVYFKNGLIASYQEIGDAYLENKEYTKAVPAYEKFQNLLTELATANPQNLAFKNGVAVAFGKLGEVYRLSEDYPKAKESFLSAKKAYLELIKAYPQYAEFQQNLLSIEDLLYKVYYANKEWRTQYELALEQTQRKKEQNRPSAELAQSYNWLAWAALYAREFAEAEKYSLLGLAADNTQEWMNVNLATAYLLQGKYAQAEAIYQQWKDKPYDKTTYKEEFLRYLKDLEAEGITHPDVIKAKNLLNK